VGFCALPEFLYVGILALSLMRRFLHILRRIVIFIFPIEPMVKISLLMIEQSIAVKVVVFKIELSGRGVKNL
jgi:hypothetical protein